MDRILRALNELSAAILAFQIQNIENNQQLLNELITKLKTELIKKEEAAKAT